VRAIREAQADKEKTKEIRKALTDFKQTLSDSAKTANIPHPKKGALGSNDTHSAKAKSPLQGRFRGVKKETPVRNDTTTEITVGDAVRMKGQRTIGEVIEKKGKHFVVAFGAIKTSVKAEQIEKVSNRQIKKENAVTIISANSSDSMSEKKLNFKTEIDLRGMRAEEALQAVTYYIDDAIQCNVGRVRILHGTGTGALRQIIRDYLKTVWGIKRFQDEHVQFGGAGITVVEFE
jgi:DNA mismatch repair protein MutS2